MTRREQQEYFISLCLIYPNLGSTLLEIQAVGRGQQSALSDKCKGYIQGFIQALNDARAMPAESLSKLDAFVYCLLSDSDILRSFAKDFKLDIEEVVAACQEGDY